MIASTSVPRMKQLKESYLCTKNFHFMRMATLKYLPLSQVSKTPVNYHYLKDMKIARQVLAPDFLTVSSDGFKLNPLQFCFSFK